ncbi:hypothetical protein [Ekhidna sp.]|uniref:hypothetical protein n=1 Tax=Ekhidna sp. TaxID=2608089 RepID=UPI0032985D0C
MRNIIIIIWLMNALIVQSQTDMVTLLNFPVGGTWLSENIQNDGKPNSFAAFSMQFKTWSSESSVLGNIYGIKNNGDTIQLMEVWNFIEPDGKSAFLVQRASWGGRSVGSVVPYEGTHLDIQFKSTSDIGDEYFTRDIHYVISKNEMKSVSYHKRNEDNEWQLAGESIWKRKEL